MSIEGYSNAYSNNIEGNSTDSILQAEIDLLQYNTTDITFNGVNKTTINNDLTITGVLAIPSFSNVGTTLTGLNSSVSTINTTLTGISYSNAGSIDLTTIDNNVTIGTGKTLSIPNFTNVETTLTGINTTLTGFSYLNTSGQDLTTINNNVTIGTGKVLNIDNYLNVGSYLDLILFNIDHIVNESTYTAVYDDFTIADGYKLKVSSTFTDVGATLTSLTTALTDISYSTDTTTINNNLTLSTGKKLKIDEIWSKYYSTHDITDTMGVGYFKTWFYNDGSIGYISTVDPLYSGTEDVSTSTEIRIRVSDNDYKFSNYGLSLNWKNLDLVGDVQLPTYASLVTELDTINSRLTALETAMPVGTIISSMATTAPAGYLALNGQLVLIASYSALYAIIGTTWNALYSGGSVPSGYFYLADTKGAFLRASGTNGMTTYSHCEGSSVGGFQIDLVKEHNHTYTASTGTQTCASGIGASARNNATTTYNTSNELYNASNVAFGHTENRVFNMAVNYYIKY